MNKIRLFWIQAKYIEKVRYYKSTQQNFDLFVNKIKNIKYLVYKLENVRLILTIIIGYSYLYI